jgi:hypothetical protein
MFPSTRWTNTALERPDWVICSTRMMGSLMSMTSDDRVTTPEAARGLGIQPEDVYRLVFAGELEGRPGEDGVVRISERMLADYLERHTRV